MYAEEQRRFRESKWCFPFPGGGENPVLPDTSGPLHSAGGLLHPAARPHRGCHQQRFSSWYALTTHSLTPQFSVRNHGCFYLLGFHGTICECNWLSFRTGSQPDWDALMSSVKKCKCYLWNVWIWNVLCCSVRVVFVVVFTRGAPGLRGQEEGSRGEHAASPWASQSQDSFHRVSAGFHRAGKCPRLLELCTAGQVGWSQVREGPHSSQDFHFLVAVKVIELKCISCVFSFCRTSRFASFPEYLVVQIKKFTFGVDWVPKKLGNYLKTPRTSNHFKISAPPPLFINYFPKCHDWPEGGTSRLQRYNLPQNRLSSVLRLVLKVRHVSTCAAVGQLNARPSTCNKYK